MLSFRDFIDPGGSIVTRRLTQLCDRLERLGERLRGALANVVGEAIGYVVRDAALRILHEGTHHSSTADSFLPRPPENEFDSLAHRVFEDEDGFESQDDYGDDEDDVPYERLRIARRMPATPARLPSAISVGMQAASWWLRRWRNGNRAITTLAFGLIATVAAWVGGPLVVAVLGLAQAAMQLSSMSSVIQFSGEVAAE